MGSFHASELERFRTAVANKLGLQFDGKNELLADALSQRMLFRGCDSVDAYLASIRAVSHEREELRALASQLTVTETYFFRDQDQFDALRDFGIPHRLRARSAERRLRLLSAGCASGEEAYSLAILLLEQFPQLRSWEIDIQGIDLNPAMIAKARRAQYHSWSLRTTPSELRTRYFRNSAGDFLLDEGIRSMVRFEERNLTSDDWTDLVPFDIILCRNVIMYLVPGAAQTVIRRLTRSLVPEGYLFLGCAETLRGLSHDFRLLHTNNTFYYQKLQQTVDTQETQHFTTPISLRDLSDVAWVDAIQAASERIEGLSRDCRTEPETCVGGAVHSPVELGFMFELLRQERFREALDKLHTLPPEASGDPDTQLLRAGLMANCGDLEGAEAVCRQILSADDLNSGAHYLMALAREHAGDLKGAIDQDRAAIYLDSTFAMPHLHLGRIAKRSADFTTARQELEQAGMLLSREDSTRILLFGGGFSREALVAFSRAEHRACGGSA